MDITLKVKRIQVLLRKDSPDVLYIEIEGAPTFPRLGTDCCLRVDCETGHGIKWCREIFGVEPHEVLDMRGES